MTLYLLTEISVLIGVAMEGRGFSPSSGGRPVFEGFSP